jgi:hypothetical protein
VWCGVVWCSACVWGMIQHTHTHTHAHAVVDTTPYYDLVRIIQAQHKKRREEKKAEGKQSTAADSPSSFSSSSSTPSFSSSSSSSFSSSSSGATSNSNKASTSTPQQPPKPRMPRSWSIDQSSGLTATPSSPELRAEVDWDSVLRVYKVSIRVCGVVLCSVVVPHLHDHPLISLCLCLPPLSSPH